MLRCVLAMTVAVLMNATFSFSQDSNRSDYKLLWKISGKGLKKPSYLFGTMHVRDNRAFDFSDSVLMKVQECEAYAMEVHPDSAVKAVLETFLGRGERDHFATHLKSDEYNTLDSLLIAKTGHSLKKYKNPHELSTAFWQRFEKTDKEAFLDAWLFNIARDLSKKILGLENYHDLKLLDRDNAPRQIDELKQQLEYYDFNDPGYYEAMIKLYHSGDIDSLRKVSIRNTDASDYDNLITKRNVGMVNNIVKEIHQHSTFIAVGAAHLPGEEGIINLLRQKGYTVAEVPASFTGMASQFKVEKKKLAWLTYTEDDGGYKIDMPQKPFPLSPPSVPLIFQTAFDLGTTTFFMSTYMPKPSHLRGKPGEEVLKELSRIFAEKQEMIASREINVGGFAAREFDMQSEGYHFRMQTIVTDMMVYMLIGGGTETSSASADVERFFASFKIESPKVALKMETLTQAAGAFSIDMPGKVAVRLNQPIDEAIGRAYKIHAFIATNNLSGDTYLVRYNDFPAGYVSFNDSTYMHESAENVVAAMNGTDLKEEYSKFQDFPSLNFSCLTADGNLKIRGFIVMRGNRFYMVLGSSALAEENPNLRAFLSSFKFLAYQRTVTKPVVFPDGVSLNVPENFQEDSTFVEGADAKEYSFVDVNSGICFTIQVESLDPYYEVKDLKDFFDRGIKNLFNGTHTIIKEQPIRNVMGMEYWTKSPLINATTRTRIIVAGDKLISLWAYIPNDHALSNVTEDVFNSLTVKSTSSWKLLDDKTEKLLLDLSSGDSVTRATAKQAISDHPFEVGDISKIYTAIVKKYPDDNERYGNTKRSLLNLLTTQHDSTTAPFIEKLYYTLPDSLSLRDVALSVLFSLKNEKDARTAVTFIKNDSTHNFNGYTVLSDFYDSLELHNPVISDLFDQASRFDFNYTLFNIVKMALDSGVLKTDVKEKLVGQIIRFAEITSNMTLLPKTHNDYWTQHGTLVNTANLLTAIPFSGEVKDIIMRMHANGDAEIRLITGIHLLKKQVTLKSSEFDLIARDPSYRLQLYRELKELNSEKLMNKRYLTARMIAESDLYEYLSYDDGTPDRVQYIAEKKVEYQGKQQVLFLFKYQFEGDEDWYTGVSGPYTIGRNAPIESGALTSAFYEVYEGDAKLMESLTKYLAENEAKVLGK